MGKGKGEKSRQEKSWRFLFFTYFLQVILVHGGHPHSALVRTFIDRLTGGFGIASLF